MADYPLATIVLAAGASSRMGQPKFFLPVNGRSLLQLAIAAAIRLDGLTVVVTGAEHGSIVDHVGQDANYVTIARNPLWATGMASSIAVGVRAAGDYHADIYLITLADQPEVGENQLRVLLNEYLQNPGDGRIIATMYPEGPGVPAIFPVRYREALLNANGRHGARELLRSGNYPVVSVDLGFVPADIDTPEDYRSYLSRLPLGE